MMMNARRKLDALFGKPEPVIILDVRASRAIYVDEDHSEIEMTVTLENGVPIALRMTPRLAHKMVGQLSIAYDAINPPITNATRAATWLGMGS